MNLNALFEELASNNSRIFKYELLKKHEGNSTLREVVRLALDPFTQFYIRKIPTYTPFDNNDYAPISLSFALDSLYDLSARLVTGNAAVEHLKGMLESLSADDAKVIERIIQKDLKCGVSTSTANDVWLGLVSEYPCMLCSQYEEKLVNKINWPAFVQLKEDGMRFNAIVRDGKVEYKSRNGKTIDLLGYLDEDFIAMANGGEYVFDGELLVLDTEGTLDRQTGNGILNKAVKGTISDKEASMVNATVWDVIPYVMFTSGYYDFSYANRYGTLSVKVGHAKSGKIHLIETTMVDTLEEAQEKFQAYLADGKEGIILKDILGIWENKRSKSQIKFKGELECDLKVVGLEEGTGKYQGSLGSLVCESSDGLLKVNVGSGLTDEDRAKLNYSSTIGKIISVKYNARIKNKQGEESLFLPIFIELREDKTEADNSKDIK